MAEAKYGLGRQQGGNDYRGIWITDYDYGGGQDILKKKDSPRYINVENKRCQIMRKRNGRYMLKMKRRRKWKTLNKGKYGLEDHLTVKHQ